MLVIKKRRSLIILFLALSGCAADGGRMAEMYRQYGPEINAKSLYLDWFYCESYKLDMYQNSYPCESYDVGKRGLQRSCGIFHHADACEALDIYERRYKNNPAPVVVGLPSSGSGRAILPRKSAIILWGARINCERYKSGSGGDPTSCETFEKYTQKYAQACEERATGASGADNECNVLELYNREFRDRPDPGPRAPATPPRQAAEPVHPTTQPQP